MIDLSNYTMLQRSTVGAVRSVAIRVRTTKGFTISGELMKQMGCRAVEVYTSSSGDEVILRACAMDESQSIFTVQKSGGVNAQTLVDDLTAKGVALPAVYGAARDPDDSDLWVCKLKQAENPPAAAKRAAKKPRKSGLATMLPNRGGG